MLVRVLVFCLNAEDGLSFSKGLSDSNEPALWSHTLDGQIASWIEVGEPSVDRIKKATRLAQRVSVYCFNTRADVWWVQSAGALNSLGVSVFRFAWEEVTALEPLLQRTMSLSVTISESSIYVSDDQRTLALNVTRLSGQQ